MNMNSSSAFAAAVKALVGNEAEEGTLEVEVDGTLVTPVDGGLVVFAMARLVVCCELAWVVMGVAGCAKAVPDVKLVRELSLDGETAADCGFVRIGYASRSGKRTGTGSYPD
jgi:hypothetical protein